MQIKSLFILRIWRTLLKIKYAWGKAAHRYWLVLSVLHPALRLNKSRCCGRASVWGAHDRPGMLMGVDDVHRDPVPVGEIMIHTSEKEWEEYFYIPATYWHLVWPWTRVNQWAPLHCNENRHTEKLLVTVNNPACWRRAVTHSLLICVHKAMHKAFVSVETYLKLNFISILRFSPSCFLQCKYYGKGFKTSKQWLLGGFHCGKTRKWSEVDFLLPIHVRKETLLISGVSRAGGRECVKHNSVWKEGCSEGKPLGIAGNVESLLWSYVIETGTRTLHCPWIHLPGAVLEKEYEAAVNATINI